MKRGRGGINRGKSAGAKACYAAVSDSSSPQCTLQSIELSPNPAGENGYAKKRLSLFRKCFPGELERVFLRKAASRTFLPVDKCG